MSDFEQERLIRSILPDSYFIRLGYPLLRTLEPLELILLYYLVNWAGMKARNDGWFWCTMRQIMDELGLSQSKYTRTLKSLRDKKFIKIKTEGVPSKRWIKINYVLIGQQIVEIVDEISKKREERSLSGTPKEDKKSIKYYDDEWSDEDDDAA